MDVGALIAGTASVGAILCWIWEARKRRKTKNYESLGDTAAHHHYDYGGGHHGYGCSSSDTSCSDDSS